MSSRHIFVFQLVCATGLIGVKSHNPESREHRGSLELRHGVRIPEVTLVGRHEGKDTQSLVHGGRPAESNHLRRFNKFLRKADGLKKAPTYRGFPYNYRGFPYNYNGFPYNVPPVVYKGKNPGGSHYDSGILFRWMIAGTFYYVTL